MILEEIEFKKYFPFVREIPYKTFYNMPKRFESVPEFFSMLFNYKQIKIKDFVNLFLSSPKKYEELATEGAKKTLEYIQKVENLYKKYWKVLSDKEKIAFGFALLHVYFASWRKYSIYEILIDCPPPKFNIESYVPKEKLKLLEEIKEKCTKIYYKKDIYEIINIIMNNLRDIISKNKDLIKQRYKEELEEIFSFKNFYEMMQNSVLQLLYKHPGIYRFKQPIPKIFEKYVKYISPPENYFSFPIENFNNLVGLGASPGKVKGKVKICYDVEEALNKIEDGDILVCPKTDPSWTVVLNKVSGIITESGGLLSHAAIIARELKIPCVVGVKNVLKKLRDGDIVEIDGETGEIKILNAITKLT